MPRANNGRRYLLDTSAVLAFIEDEAGAERVAQVMAEGRALLPWVALLETYSTTHRKRGQIEAQRRYLWLKEAPATILWETDEPTLLIAGRLKATHRLSLADALIAAYAIRHQTTLLHKDPEYAALADAVPQEALPAKGVEG